MKLIFSLFCRDIEAQQAFYQAMFGWPERLHARSPIYRGLETPNSALGLHGPPARGLLGLPPGEPAQDALVRSYPTIQLPAWTEVEALAAKAVSLGGAVIKPPFATYYGQWQAVLADPEGHMFRLACETLPPGVEAPQLVLG
jgi:predicted enzyme related to lactoylglutathione lyase